MMKKVVTIGSSAAITISPAELRELGLKVGDRVQTSVQAGTLELRPIDKYAGATRQELLAHINQHRTRS